MSASSTSSKPRSKPRSKPEPAGESHDNSAPAVWDDTTEQDPGEYVDATDQLPSEPPTTGYVWVQRKRTAVQIGVTNYTDDGPHLVDAKSVPELAQQGYVVVDAPEGDGSPSTPKRR